LGKRPRQGSAATGVALDQLCQLLGVLPRQRAWAKQFESLK
jgi:hypothetical protein